MRQYKAMGAAMMSFGAGAQELYVMDACDAADVEYKGRLESIHDIPEGVAVFPLGSTPAEKENLMAQMSAARVMPATVIHPTAVVSRTAVIGQGVLINAFVSVTQKADIGPGVVIHVGCVIGHDNIIGAFASLSPGCLLAGGVYIGSRASLGTGVIVVPNKRVECGATVWAGATVQMDVAPFATHYVMPDKQPFRKAGPPVPVGESGLDVDMAAQSTGSGK